ncbi:MAG: UPF0149 family protein [Pseudomonadota bacterium]
MQEKVDHDRLEDALQRCGASWDSAQTHGLLAGRLSVGGVAAAPEWLMTILEGVDENNAQRTECQKLLDSLYQTTYLELSERLSEFEPLLPPDQDDVGLRTQALAHWSEGFLHGLVSGDRSDELKERLGKEPLSDIIRDMLQITRAGLDGDVDEEDNESAYAELVEYLRVAAQLAFEELADIRNRAQKQQ